MAESAREAECGERAKGRERERGREVDRVRQQRMRGRARCAPQRAARASSEARLGGIESACTIACPRLPQHFFGDGCRVCVVCVLCRSLRRQYFVRNQWRWCAYRRTFGMCYCGSIVSVYGFWLLQKPVACSHACVACLASPAWSCLSCSVLVRHSAHGSACLERYVDASAGSARPLARSLSHNYNKTIYKKGSTVFFRPRDA